MTSNNYVDVNLDINSWCKILKKDYEVEYIDTEQFVDYYHSSHDYLYIDSLVFSNMFYGAAVVASAAMVKYGSC